MNAPQWLEPIGFVKFAPALREDPGGCESADHPKIACTAESGARSESPVWFWLCQLRHCLGRACSGWRAQFVVTPPPRRPKPDRLGAAIGRALAAPAPSARGDERNCRSAPCRIGRILKIGDIEPGWHANGGLGVSGVTAAGNTTLMPGAIRPPGPVGAANVISARRRCGKRNAQRPGVRTSQ